MDKETQIITSEFNEILGAFDQVNDSMIIIDPSTEKIINANCSACKLYEYDKNEFIGISLSAITKDFIKCKEKMYRVVSEETSEAFEVIQVSSSGKTLQMEVSLSLVTYNNRKAILCVGRDIGTRKRMEKTLRESEEKYRKLVEGMNVITWSYDIESDNYTYVSPAAVRLLGYPLEKWFAGDFWFNIVHPDDREKIISLSNEYIKAGIDYEFEYRVLPARGEMKWVKDITSVNVSEGKAHSLQGVLIDITEKKKIEDALKSSEEQLSLMFENAPIGKTLTTLDGRLLRVNKAFADLVGYSKEELQSMNFREITHTADLSKNIELLEKAASDGTGFVMEKRYIKKTGGIIYASTNVSVLKDKSGKPYRLVAQIVDITRQKLDEARLSLTENRLGALLNNLSDIVFYESDADGVFISDNIKEMTGYLSGEFAGDKYLFENLMHPEDRERINSQVSSWRVNENPSSLNFEFRLRKKDGSYIWIEDHMFGITSSSRSYWSGFMIDVSDRKISEKKLEETQTRLTAILNNLPNVVFYESEKDKVFVSDNVYEILGYKAEDIENQKISLKDLIHPGDIAHLEFGDKIRKKVIENKYVKQEFRLKKSSGEYIWLEDHIYAVLTNDKEYIVGFMMDISDRKITEQRLEETQMRLAAVLNNLTNVVFYENAFGKQFISENIMEMLGYPVEEFYTNPDLFDSLIHPVDLAKVIHQTDSWYHTGAKGTYREIFRIKRKDGKYIWLEDHMFRSQRQDGQNYYSGVMIDITERKNFEEMLADSLKEKELLIKEIHHRVKNNLQVVSSLLKLQSTYIKDTDALDMLIDSQNRVQSMAIVHQKLYQSKDLANIDMKDYVQQLLFHLMNSFKKAGGKIILNCEVENIKIGVDTAIPCGLIINEIVSNSLKHAFPGDAAGEINVDLKTTDKNTYILKIKDNGIGFKEDFDFKNTATLGLQLVNTLVNQLEGEMNISNNGGAVFMITFKDIGE